jgi:presenilin 1
MVYHESGADSSGTRFVGSVGNALVFVGIVTVTTVLFVLLFKFRCMKILYGWLIGSTSLTLGAFGGAALWLIFSASNIALDYGTYAFVVWNFAVCGILAIFWRSPPMVNRAYLIAVSALMAFFFTFMPEWSTWCLLVAISLCVSVFDLVFGPSSFSCVLGTIWLLCCCRMVRCAC